MFLDVPFFYYLSGWASNYRKPDIKSSVKSIGKIWGRWIFFVTILTAFCALSKWLPVQFEGVTNIKDLINCFMFNVSISGFPVVAGSIWFMPIYFVVIIGNALIMMIIQASSRPTDYKRLYVYLLGILFLWVYYGNYFFNIDAGRFLFYSFFWMLGYNKFGKVKELKHHCVCNGCIGGNSRDFIYSRAAFI